MAAELTGKNQIVIQNLQNTRFLPQSRLQWAVSGHKTTERANERMIHRGAAQGSLLSPSCPRLPPVMPDSTFPLIGGEVKCKCWNALWRATARRPDRGGPCHVLMSGLSIMQYLMREQAEITDIFSTSLSTVIRNTLGIVPELLKTCWCRKTCSILKGDRDKVGRLTRKGVFFAETITAQETNHKKILKICTAN